MIRNAFAKLPSAWVRKPQLGVVPGTGVAPVGDPGTEIVAKSGLMMLQWRQHKGAGTAALLILFSLAVISNRAQRADGLRKDDTVAATYEQIQAMVPLSRKLISDGVQLLVMLGAIDQRRDGRRSLFTLRGIEENGQWCALPQAHLHNQHGHLHRLQLFVDQIRRPTSLHAIKLYMLFLAQRDRHANLAAVGYDKITLYTGVRREEIPTAIQILVSMQLIRLLTDEELPRRTGDPYHNRYFVCGLNAS